MKQELHVWFREQIETFLADGLAGDERTKFEGHLQDCESCAAEYQDALAADRALRELFAPVQPRSGFEDRVVQKLRAAPGPRTKLSPRFARIISGVAAVLLLGIVGYVVSYLESLEGGRMDRFVAEPNHSFGRFSAKEELRKTPGPAVAHLKTPDELARDRSEEILLTEKKTDREPMQLHRAEVTDKSHDPRAKRGMVAKELEPAADSPSAYYSFRDDASPSALAQVKFFRPADYAPKAEPPKPAPDTPAAAPQDEKAAKPSSDEGRKIIRQGEMEFEVESFDSAFLQITRIVKEEGGYVSGTNSEKLPNGKVRGTVTVRVPPDRLDVLVLKLRALGDLKSQRISAQDVTKQYTDLESELRAARAMEERLMNIIKSGKGEIKDLLEAEKQLGVWREKIEKLEGEIRYYNNLISLSTLAITLYEKDIKTPAVATQTETVNAGVEVEDVEKTYQEALKAISEARGRVIESELKKFEAGQMAAKIVADLPPGAGGTIIDRLRQLGRIARLDIDRRQSAQAGAPVKVEQKDSRFQISLYNVANIAPRETTQVSLACPDVEGAYQELLARVQKAGGRVVASNLNRQQAEQTSAVIQYELRAGDVPLDDLGEVIRRTVTENPDTNNVTSAKRGYQVQLYALGSVAPRETIRVDVAARNVPDAYRALMEAIQKVKGRVLLSQLDEHDRHNVTGRLDVEVRRSDLASVQQALAAAGDVISRNAGRSTDVQNTVDSKVRLQVNLTNAALLAPRETTTIAIEVAEVDRAFGEILAQTAGAGGRTVESHLSHERSGRVVGKLVVDVPLKSAGEFLAKIRGLGVVRMVQSSHNPQVPEGELARARFDVTVANAELLVPSDQGVGAWIRKGLSTSLTGLLWSLNLIIIGLCFVGPWALIVWFTLRLVKRVRAKSQPAAG